MGALATTQPATEADLSALAGKPAASAKIEHIMMHPRGHKRAGALVALPDAGTHLWVVAADRGQGWRIAGWEQVGGPVLAQMREQFGKPAPTGAGSKGASTQPGERQRTKAQLMKWVEGFFRANYRDITARQTLEWGVPQKAPGGNLSIRYKYLATIWGKDKLIIEQVFVFSPKGEFVSVRQLGKSPATQPAPTGAGSKGASTQPAGDRG